MEYDRVWYFAKPKLFPVLDKLVEDNRYGNVYVRSYPITDDVFSL